MNVSLSRHRKTAYEERLFSTEVAWHSRMRARIEGWLDSQKKALQAAALLLLAAKAGYAIGAARSRGLGWIRLVQWVVRVNERLVSVGEDEVAFALDGFKQWCR
jgi:CRISPR/Cas system CSM-associated protein Csm3 (group 7 of RAMP superfamily)